LFHQEDTKARIPIADELGKLAKLRARSYNRRRIFADEKQFDEEDIVRTSIVILIYDPVFLFDSTLIEQTPRVTTSESLGLTWLPLSLILASPQPSTRQ
jgi:hypothetical protein